MEWFFCFLPLYVCLNWEYNLTFYKLISCIHLIIWKTVSIEISAQVKIMIFFDKKMPQKLGQNKFFRYFGRSYDPRPQKIVLWTVFLKAKYIFTIKSLTQKVLLIQKEITWSQLISQFNMWFHFITLKAHSFSTHNFPFFLAISFSTFHSSFLKMYDKSYNKRFNLFS